MDHCELCDMPHAWCQHGRAARTAVAADTVTGLLISPTGYAHFPGCAHKDDDDMSRWGALDTPHAWTRLGNGEQLQATAGRRPDRIARQRCADCVAHGPWL
jgi:hypothetical protein